jgi:hypothetical protein
VDDILLLGRDDERNFFKQVTAYYDAPAYVRRARGVQESLEAKIRDLRATRLEWTLLPRTLLGLLQMRAGCWMALRPLLQDDAQVEVLVELETELQPRPRLREPAIRSPAKLRRSLRELVYSLRRFNERWLLFVTSVDLEKLNQIRADYNRYYLLEKECALRSPRLARQGFVPLAPMTLADLLERLPPLPVPELDL